MFIFPAHILCPNNVKAGVVSRVISGGTSISGIETAIATDGGGLWNITYSDIDISSSYDERLWDAWVAHMAGGIQPFLVPVLSLETAPAPFMGENGIYPSDLEVDDDEFPTLMRFKSPFIEAKTVGDTQLRSTEITIEITQGATIKNGQKFSIGGSAYTIERVKSRPSPLIAVCKITPPLRRAVEHGSAVNFEWPLIKCKAVIGQDLNPMMEMGKYSNVSVSFVEDVSPDAN